MAKKQVILGDAETELLVVSSTLATDENGNEVVTVVYDNGDVIKFLL